METKHRDQIPWILRFGPPTCLWLGVTYLSLFLLLPAVSLFLLLPAVIKPTEGNLLVFGIGGIAFLIGWYIFRDQP